MALNMFRHSQFLICVSKLTTNNLAIVLDIEASRRSFDSIMDHREIDMASLRQFNLYDLTRGFDFGIESLSKDSFDNLSNLATLTLRLQSSTNTSFDVTSIEKLIELNVLLIQNNSMEKPKLALNFSAFENLEDCYLNGFDVDLDEFRSLNTLGKLSFGDCKLGHLISNNFIEMTCLSELFISDCAIETLDADVFAHLVNLKRLSLGWNRLTALHEDTFKALTCLEDLELSENKITELKENIFETNTKLEFLQLSK